MTEIRASDMPVIIPALDTSLAANIQHVAQRYFNAGEQKLLSLGPDPCFFAQY